MRPSLRAVPLAQGVHRLPVGVVEGGQGVHHAADADAALTAQNPLRHLRNLVGQDMQVLAEIRGAAHQNRNHLPGGVEADAAQVFCGQLVHRRHKGGGGAVGPALIQQDGHHHRTARPVVQIPEQAALPRVLLRLHRSLRIGVVVQHQGHQHGGLQIHPMHLGGRLPEPGKLGVDFLPDSPQLRRYPLHGQRLEHIADDVVLDRLLGVLKVVVAA